MAEKEHVYGAFVDYYGTLSLKLLRTDNDWAFYCAKIYSGLNQNRYIFVVIPANSAVSKEATLDQLDWVSFQTRTTDETHHVPTHHLYLNDTRKKTFSDKITVVKRTQDETEYITQDLPIKVRLLHDPKKNNYLQYPDQALMYQALETYRCVVDLL